MSASHGVAEARLLLICLDALTPVADCDVAGPAWEGAWCEAARRLLGYARETGWSVAHVITARSAVGRAGWRAIPGLAPRIEEPVFHRDEPSAFSNENLRRRLAETPAEVVLTGWSTRASCLATAFDAVHVGASVSIAVDAVWMGAGEREGLEALVRLQQLGGPRRGRVRLSSVAALARARPSLRLVEGGRG